MRDPCPTLLDRADPAAIRTRPFPHLVIEDALPADLYRALASTRLDCTRIIGPPPHASNRRFAWSTRMMLWDERATALWKRFVAVHTGADFVFRVLSLFADHLPDGFPRLSADTPVGVLERDGHDAFPILADARLELNTPVTGPASSVRGAHVDTPNRLYSCLFYMRADGDDSVGGDLELYRYTGPVPDPVDAFQFRPDQVEAVTTVPYRANTLVIYPNHRFAIHGVTPRQPTEHERAYVFVTAEREQDWFTARGPIDAAARVTACA